MEFTKLNPAVDEVVLASFLAAISVVFQVGHVFTGVSTPWFIWIDIVAVPWLVAYFMKGFKTALLTAILSSFVISLVAPSTFVGAIMKFVATFPMFLVPALVAVAFRKKIRDFSSNELFVFASISLVLALLVRVAIVLPFNYYFAIPVFFKMPTEEAIKFLPPLILAGLNCVQGTLEFLLALALSFFTRLRDVG
ncbi:MAG: hypothetical protein J7L23_01285 [Candidatus Diapherotrites archaeon]|nr:hypothetical protein [Candidatus Diapherotrites archaeon]